jgi:hypothetical protein
MAAQEAAGGLGGRGDRVRQGVRPQLPGVGGEPLRPDDASAPLQFQSARVLPTRAPGGRRSNALSCPVMIMRHCRKRTDHTETLRTPHTHRS